jgi:hypothetical protein
VREFLGTPQYLTGGTADRGRTDPVGLDDLPHRNLTSGQSLALFNLLLPTHSIIIFG